MSQDFISQLGRNFDLTQLHLKTMEMASSGWNAHVVDPVISAGPQVHLYAWDPLTNWLWLGCVEREGFLNCERHGQRFSPEELESLRGAIGLLISQAADKQPLPDLDGLSWEQQLGFMLSLYAGTTRTAAMVNYFQDGGHFLMANYRFQSGGPLLRPAAVPNIDNAPLSVRDLQERFTQLLQYDQARHPEWFDDSKGMTRKYV